MARHFDVVGDVLGYDEEGYEVVGAAPAAHPPAGVMLRLPRKADWRRGQLAPGVQAPDEGMVPLPLSPQQGAPAGTFSATVTQITFQGQLQKPYRAERILVSSVRTGATAVGRLLGQIFVGTDLQGAEIQAFDLELVGATTAFGTRLTLVQAPPGVLIRVPVTLSSPLTSPDTIFMSAMFLGRWIY